MGKLESREDYLERILMLSETNQRVRAIDIANSMNYTKASVSSSTVYCSTVSFSPRTTAQSV